MRVNYHREHFGRVWGIHDAKGELAHTSCVAFGIDRLTVALFAIHGLDPRQPRGNQGRIGPGVPGVKPCRSTRA